MKLTIEPNKLVELLDIILLGGKGGKDQTGLDAVELVFDQDRCYVNDVTLGSVCIIAEFKSSYFNEYEIPETGETLVVSENLLKIMKGNIFKLDERITLEKTINEDIATTFIILKGATEDIEEAMEVLKTQSGPNTRMDDTLGLVPEKLNANIMVKIDKNQLNLPKVGDKTLYHFNSKKNILQVTSKDEGTVATRKMSIVENKKLDDINIKFDGKFFDKMLKFMPVEVWMTIHNNVGLVLSTKQEHYSLTYMMTCSK